MSKLGIILMTLGVICMASGAGGCDSGTCSLWASVLWVIGGMIIGCVGARFVEYGK